MTSTLAFLETTPLLNMTVEAEILSQSMLIEKNIIMYQRVKITLCAF